MIPTKLHKFIFIIEIISYLHEEYLEFIHVRTFYCLYFTTFTYLILIFLFHRVKRLQRKLNYGTEPTRPTNTMQNNKLIQHAHDEFSFALQCESEMGISEGLFSVE